MEVNFYIIEGDLSSVIQKHITEKKPIDEDSVKIKIKNRFGHGFYKFVKL